ncbi:MAG: histidine kinase dimerization/phospho-acceptor domain-containing protein, partial [Halobacteria archaeon]|nr:histidine kinase dimerization/phospho-acceptor domain-containing protein [Halobacteria archaeon]
MDEEKGDGGKGFFDTISGWASGISLRTQFVVILVVTLVILVGVTYLGFEAQKQEIVERQKITVKETAEVIASRLNYQLSEKKRSIRLAAQMDSLTKFGTKEQHRTLKRFAEISQLNTVALLSANGTKVDFWGVPEKVRQKLIGQKYSDRGYFENAMQGEVHITEPFVADTGNQLVVISAPLRKNGSIVGVIGGSILLNSESFFKSVNTLQREGQRVVVTDEGKDLYNTTAPLDNPITGTATVSSTGWTVTVARSRSFVSNRLGSIFGNLLISEASVIVVVVIISLFGLWVYSTNLRQTREIMEGLTSLKEGDYGREVDLEGSKEWKNIEESFDELTEVLDKRETQIRNERDRFATLFENVPDAAVVVEMEDGTPVVESVNSEFEKVFGYDADEVVGKPLDEFIVPEDKGSRTYSEFDDTDRVRKEVRRETAGGEVRDFLFRRVPIRSDVSDDDSDAESFGIYTDITQRNRDKRRLENQKKRLDRFAGVVSHDLRNPLSVAVAYLDMVREKVGSEEDEELRSHIERVRESHERMDGIIEDALKLARQGEEVTEASEVSLKEVAEEAWSVVENADAELDCDEGRVEADRSRLLQVFENLFSNSVKHGGEDVTVRVRATDE